MRLFQANEQFSEKCKEVDRHQICGKWKKSRPPSARAQLLHNKIVFKIATDIKNKQKWVNMNEQVYLGTSILDISKIAMYVYWYGYVKLSIEAKQNYATQTQAAS